MDVGAIINGLSGVATAIGVGVAAWQLRMSKDQAQSAYEDGFGEQYRDIVNKLPLDALLGKPLEPATLRSALRCFYRYFDLCNDQAFLAARHRIRPETWENWLEGIQRNFARPGFRQAWQELFPDLDGSFNDLRQHLPRDLHKPKT